MGHKYKHINRYSPEHLISYSIYEELQVAASTCSRNQGGFCHDFPSGAQRLAHSNQTASLNVGQGAHRWANPRNKCEQTAWLPQPIVQPRVTGEPIGKMGKDRPCNSTPVQNPCRTKNDGTSAEAYMKRLIAGS